MSNYTGSKCPVCQKAFTDHDDIVVCPDCGTPYHRTCWPADNRCVFAAKHGTNYEWKPEAKAQAESEGAAGAQQAREQQAANYRVYQLHPDDEIEGVKARDWAAFFGPSAPYYLLRFQAMAATGRKFCVSLSAFLFGPLYFLYRKAWKPAVFFAVLSLLLEVPGILTLLYIAGDLPAWLNSAALISRLTQIGGYINWIQMFLRGVFGVYLYRQAVMPKVKDLCANMPDGAERQAALRRVGGTSIPAMLAYVAVLALLYLAVYAYVMSLGPAAINKLVAYTQQMMNYLS